MVIKIVNKINKDKKSISTLCINDYEFALTEDDLIKLLDEINYKRKDLIESFITAINQPITDKINELEDTISELRSTVNKLEADNGDLELDNDYLRNILETNNINLID